MRLRVSLLLGWFLVFGWTVYANAHEFWIEPSSFRPEKDSLIKVNLYVGEPFQGEVVLRNERLITDFSVNNLKEKQRVLGVEGQAPAGFSRFKSPGVHIFSYVSQRSLNQLNAERFEEYLKEDGLEGISVLRVQKGESHLPGREFFSRCAKSIVEVPGKKKRQGYNRRLGLTLELVPEKDPFSLKAGDPFPVKIFYKNHPRENILIRCVNQQNPDHIQLARSDKNGRAVFQLNHPGVWLVAGVHMVRLKNEPDADWESFWASLTFEVIFQ